jgi:glutathione S-transferase
MSTALPRKWFPGTWMAKAKFAKVDWWAEFHRKNGHPYFDTWEEAHQHMVEKSKERLKRAQRELKSAEAFAKRVALMKPPA